jgi:hypothetical protein
MVYLAFTSTYMATKKARKKRTPQDRVISSLDRAGGHGVQSVQGWVIRYKVPHRTGSSAHLTGQAVIEYKVYRVGY